ncbi:MAG: YeiH family protein [Bacteroidia bacterium]
MFKIPKNIMAWLVLLALGFSGNLLNGLIPGPGNITWALILAILAGNLILWSDSQRAVYKYAEKHLLSLATILLGFGLNVRLLQQLPWHYLLIIVLMVLLALSSSQLYCGKMGRGLRWLLGAGNAICGNSAIAATAPSLKASLTEIGLAVTVVNLLGTIGIFIFPPIAHLFGLSASETALFTGAILQSVGHVVAAGYSIDPEVGALALLIKMGRILMLGPVILFIGWRFNRNEGAQLSLSVIPNYVWGFLLAAAITSTGIIPPTYTKGLEKTGTHLLLIAMTGIGLGINIREMLQMGPRAALSGSLIFITQIVVLLGLLLMMR